MPSGKMFRRLSILIAGSALLLAQDSRRSASSPVAQSSAPPPATATSPADADLAQVRDDLNKMESLNMNMSSEIEFLHDQNLQILLRTNSQMWTLLIRDMRRQLQQEEQRRAATPGGPKK